MLAGSETLDNVGNFDFDGDVYILDYAVGTTPVDLMVGGDQGGGLLADTES